jgi:hypothetical protein
MKNILLAVLLLVPALAWAQKPPEYPISVHVQASRVVDSCAGNPAQCFSAQRLTVVIDGKKYELEGGRDTLLRTGDYKAKLDKDEAKHAFEYQRAYEFRFEDGSTRRYTVVGELE